MKKVSAKRKLRQFTVVIEQDEDGYYVATVPEHRGEDLGRGILAKILRDAGVKPAEFLRWLS